MRQASTLPRQMVRMGLALSLAGPTLEGEELKAVISRGLAVVDAGGQPLVSAAYGVLTLAEEAAGEEWEKVYFSRPAEDEAGSGEARLCLKAPSSACARAMARCSGGGLRRGRLVYIPLVHAGEVLGIPEVPEVNEQDASAA